MTNWIEQKDFIIKEKLLVTYSGDVSEAITKKLSVSGSEELVAKIRSEISSTHDDGSPRPIDFNKIANLPKELKNTTSPSRIISQEEYDTQEARIAAGDLTGN